MEKRTEFTKEYLSKDMCSTDLWVFSLSRQVISPKKDITDREMFGWKY